MPANTPTQAKIGYGSRLACQFDGVTYTDIAEVRNIGFPNLIADDIKVTNQDSPNRTHEYISGMTEPGEVAMSMNWLPNDVTQDHLTGLLELKQSGDTVNWRIITPDGDLTTVFPGYVKSFAPAIPTEDAMTADIVIKVTGAPTFS